MTECGFVVVVSEVMCACFDIGYALSNTSDDERTASTVQCDTSQEYERFLSPVSEHELCESVRQRVPASMCTTDVWCRKTYC